MTSLVTLPTGQLVTVGWQLVMVYVLVICVVIVSRPWPGVGCVGWDGFSVSVTGHTVVDTGMTTVVV